MRRSTISVSVIVALLATAPVRFCAAQDLARKPGELVWALGSDPRTFDPAKVDDQASEAIRHLTAGVLLRFNRSTQEMEPELAEKWTISADGRMVTIRLRPGLTFSDGSRLTSTDALQSIQRVLSNPKECPTAEEFVRPEAVRLSAPDATTLIIRLPQRVIGIDRVLDEIAVEPNGLDRETRITSGPFVLTDYLRTRYVRLSRNEHYFKTDKSGHHLPYASGIRLDIQTNPDQEIRLFWHGEYDLIENLGPDYFESLKRRDPRTVRDLGPSLNTEQLWFNQSPNAPLPSWEKEWFRNPAFRTAISLSIRRDDLARVAYGGHATPAAGFVSPANAVWYDANVRVPHTDLNTARSLLQTSGFSYSGNILRDKSGHVVRFSIITNASNLPRVRMATLIQNDLSRLGIEVTIVPLDFPAIIEKLMTTEDYEACLLGLENVDPEPNAMMNIWKSSSPNHQWNPSEKSPATAWEAEIDRYIERQASASQFQERKKAIDRVQEIVAEQQPFIYLVYPNVLYAISLRLEGVEPGIVQPGLTWNPEWLSVGGSR
jgi:peptide/nickel transport system substrate-binding protein